jgi:hypothetical protein
MRLLGTLCQKATVADYLFVELNSVSMRDEQFDDVVALRRDLGTLIRSLCKCCGAQAVTAYLNTRFGDSYNKLTSASGDKYIELLCAIEGTLFVITELSKTISSD